MVNIGIAFSIAGPAIALILIIIGIVRAWSYRDTDRKKFIAIYKPYKYWGLIIWILCAIAGIALIML